jgi:hypothetical protein
MSLFFPTQNIKKSGYDMSRASWNMGNNADVSEFNSSKCRTLILEVSSIATSSRWSGHLIDMPSKLEKSA